MQGLQRQKQKQALNTCAFNCLIRKQKKKEKKVKKTVFLWLLVSQNMNK